MSDATTGRDRSSTSKTAVDVWREFFHNWPSGVPRGGVLVTTYAEHIPFGDFLTTNDMVLLDRRHPDTTGARKVLIPFHSVDAVKFTDVLTDETFHAAGFEGGSGGKATPSKTQAAEDGEEAARTTASTRKAAKENEEVDDAEESDAGAGGLSSAKYLAEQIKRQKEQAQRPARDNAPTEDKKEEEPDEKPRVKLPAWALRR